MAKRKKNQDLGKCAFCGVEGEVTQDHIPPKNLFRGFPDEQLIKVPGCPDCNGGSKLDDEYFRAFLIPQEAVASHPQAKKLNDFVREKFAENPRKGLEKRMNSQVHVKDMITPSGIYLGREQFIYPEYSRIDRSLKKIVKGLFYEESKTPLPQNDFVAVVDTSQIEELECVLNIDLRYCIEGLSKMLSRDIYGIFSYRWFVAPIRSMSIVAWHFTFFEARSYFGITYPNTLGKEFRLLDTNPEENHLVKF